MTRKPWTDKGTDWAVVSHPASKRGMGRATPMQAKDHAIDIT